MTEPKIYVCMSSVPGRCKQLPHVVDSLLANKVLPDKIFINLCEKYDRFPEEKYDLSVLDKYKDNKLITINRNCEDLGPGTKIFGCLDQLLEEEKDIENTYLLTADDDLCYRPEFVGKFKESISKDPTIAYTGFKWGGGLKINGKRFEICFGGDGISFKLSKLRTLKDFCLKLHEVSIKFKYHDDFCFTCFYHLNNIETSKVRGQIRFSAKESNIAQDLDYYIALTHSKVGGGGSARDNALCRNYQRLLNSGELDIFKF